MLNTSILVQCHTCHRGVTLQHAKKLQNGPPRGSTEHPIQRSVLEGAHRPRRYTHIAHWTLHEKHAFAWKIVWEGRVFTKKLKTLYFLRFSTCRGETPMGSQISRKMHTSYPAIVNNYHRAGSDTCRKKSTAQKKHVFLSSKDVYRYTNTLCKNASETCFDDFVRTPYF